MCDYSLMMAQSRLAVEGEELIIHRFNSGSTGLVSCRDFDQWASRRPKTFWQWIKAEFSLGNEPTPVVCIPPGALLRLIGIPETAMPETMPSEVSAISCREVVFTQISAEINQHRDALCFANGVTVLLQRLPEGQKLKVLWLSSLEDLMSNREQLETRPAA